MGLDIAEYRFLRVIIVADLVFVDIDHGDMGAAQDLAALAVKQARDTKSGFEHSAWLGRALVAFGLAQQASGQITQARNSWQEAVNELNATMGESTPASQEVRRLLAES